MTAYDERRDRDAIGRLAPLGRSLGLRAWAEVDALRSSLAAMRLERDEVQRFANRWMTAAMVATPVTTLAFDPMNPEAFAESRRHVVDEIMAERDALKSQLSVPAPPQEKP